MSQQEFSDCHAWLFHYSELLKLFEVPPSLHAAVITLSEVGINVEELLLAIEQQRPSMRAKLRQHELEIPEDHALAIFIYTLDQPSVHKAVNREMYLPDRRTADMQPSRTFLACMPFIKYLDVALDCLPAVFRVKERVYRGVKWVFPTPNDHDPMKYFFKERILDLFDFKIASRNRAEMMHDCFCGLSGPRSIFTIDAAKGFDISFFSKFPIQAEVLFRPTSAFVVSVCEKHFDPLDPSGGSPDIVVMKQTLTGINYSALTSHKPTTPRLPPTSSPQQHQGVTARRLLLAVAVAVAVAAAVLATPRAGDGAAGLGKRGPPPGQGGDSQAAAEAWKVEAAGKEAQERARMMEEKVKLAAEEKERARKVAEKGKLAAGQKEKREDEARRAPWRSWMLWVWARVSGRADSTDPPSFNQFACSPTHSRWRIAPICPSGSAPSPRQLRSSHPGRVSTGGGSPSWPYALHNRIGLSPVTVGRRRASDWQRGHERDHQRTREESSNP